MIIYVLQFKQVHMYSNRINIQLVFWDTPHNVYQKKKEGITICKGHKVYWYVITTKLC